MKYVIINADGKEIPILTADEVDMRRLLTGGYSADEIQAGHMMASLVTGNNADGKPSIGLKIKAIAESIELDHTGSKEKDEADLFNFITKNFF